MPTIRLTDLGLLNLAPLPKLTDFWDATLPTFGVRVSPKGTKTFVLKLRTGRQAIGRYPIISLSDARTEAKQILAERTLGKLRPQSITYPQAIRLFIDDKRQARPKSADQYEWFLNRLNFTCQLANIHHSDIERELKKIKSRSTYDHVLVAARIMFNWAHKRRYIAENPTFGIHRPNQQPRTRVLTDLELKKIWNACGHEVNELPPHFRKIVKLLLLTGQRRGEIAALKPSYIDLKQGTICLPSSLTKNAREHLFPFGALAAAELSGTIRTCRVPRSFFQREDMPTDHSTVGQRASRCSID